MTLPGTRHEKCTKILEIHIFSRPSGKHLDAKRRQKGVEPNKFESWFDPFISLY